MLVRTRIFRARAARPRKITSEARKAGGFSRKLKIDYFFHNYSCTSEDFPGARSASQENHERGAKSRRLFAQMRRLVCREFAKYYDLKNRYEFTLKPLSYYKRQKVIINLKCNRGFDKLDNCRTIKIDNDIVTKYLSEYHFLNGSYGSYIDFSLISKLRLLTRLRINFRNILHVSQIIKKLSHLKYLSLSYDNLISIPFEICKLKSLQYLHLNGNNLTNFPVEIYRLTSLKRLYICYNRLTNLPHEICKLTSLKRLYLNGNYLTNFPVEIGQLASLKLLYITDNPIATINSELEKIKLLLPNVEIII